MGPFMIPANTKKGKLIFNIFEPIDLGIAITGALITLVLLLIVTSNNYDNIFSILAVIPIAVATIIVWPIPNYHNVRVFFKELINYHSNPKNYRWRGWCAVYESKRGKK